MNFLEIKYQLSKGLEDLFLTVAYPQIYSMRKVSEKLKAEYGDPVRYIVGEDIERMLTERGLDDEIDIYDLLSEKPINTVIGRL